MAMMTTKLIQFWRNAAIDLRLQLVVPFCLELASGHEIKALFLVKYFGAPNGMLVFGCYEDVSPYIDEVVKAGYGFSVLDEPLENEEYDKDECIEVLADWGWGGNMEDKPDWL